MRKHILRFSPIVPLLSLWSISIPLWCENISVSEKSNNLYFAAFARFSHAYKFITDLTIMPVPAYETCQTCLLHLNSAVNCCQLKLTFVVCWYDLLIFVDF